MTCVVKCFNIKEVLNEKIYVTMALLFLPQIDFTMIEL